MIKDLARLLSPLLAMTCITLLIYKALCLGFNGTLLAIGAAIIAGLGGYEVQNIVAVLKKVKRC